MLLSKIILCNRTYKINILCVAIYLIETVLLQCVSILNAKHIMKKTFAKKCNIMDNDHRRIKV